IRDGGRSRWQCAVAIVVFAAAGAKSAEPRPEPRPVRIAGFYPKPLTAAGHDGLWYWTQARTMTAQKERWNAWLYYQQAESLLTPAIFVQSTHLEKLKTEASAAAPPALSEGVTPEAPLVVKGP